MLQSPDETVWSLASLVVRCDRQQQHSVAGDCGPASSALFRLRLSQQLNDRKPEARLAGSITRLGSCVVLVVCEVQDLIIMAASETTALRYHVDHASARCVGCRRCTMPNVVLEERAGSAVAIVRSSSIAGP